MSNALVPAPTQLVTPPKSGYLTSEFWVTISALAVAALVALNVVPATDETQIESWLSAIIGDLASKDYLAFALALIPVFKYVSARTSLKVAHQEAQAEALKPADPAPAVAPVVLPAVATVAIAPKAPESLPDAAFKV